MKKLLFALVLFGISSSCSETPKKYDSQKLKEKPVVKSQKEIVTDTVEFYAKRYNPDSASYEPRRTAFLDTAFDQGGNPCGFFIIHDYVAKNKFNALVNMQLYFLVDYQSNRVRQITKYFEFLKDLPCGKLRKLKLPNLEK